MMRSVNTRTSFSSKLFEVNWFLVALIIVVGLVGVVMIFAATDGVWSRGASQHLIRLFVCGLAMLMIALVDVKIWYNLAYPAYGLALVLLIGVELFGVSVNGSQRWLDLAILRLQPSEIMKLSIVLALARYFHDLPQWRVSGASGLLGALLFIIIPMALILRQPDLGTTLLVGATGVTLIFLAGVNWKVILSAGITALIAVPNVFRPYN